jgi:hypothetical protein
VPFQTPLAGTGPYCPGGLLCRADHHHGGGWEPVGDPPGRALHWPYAMGKTSAVEQWSRGDVDSCCRSCRRRLAADRVPNRNDSPVGSLTPGPLKLLGEAPALVGNGLLLNAAAFRGGFTVAVGPIGSRVGNVETRRCVDQAAAEELIDRLSTLIRDGRWNPDLRPIPD